MPAESEPPTLKGPAAPAPRPGAGQGGPFSPDPVAAAHWAFLGELSQKLSLITDPDSLARIACEEIGKHLGAERCFFTQSDRERGAVHIRDSWSREGLACLDGDYRQADFASAELLNAPRPRAIVIADVAEHAFTREHASRFGALGIKAFALTPFIGPDTRPTALAVAAAATREWREDEILFLENAVARVRPLVEQALALQQLREKAQRLQFAFEAAQMGDWSWNARSDMLDMSEPAAALFGIPPGPRITWTQMRERLHQDDRDRVGRALEVAVAQRQDFEAECRVVLPDGRENWVSARGRPLFAEGDAAHVSGMLGVIQDISARVRDEETRRRLAAIVESTDDAIIGKDLNGVITSWNRGAERIFGYTAREIVGRSIETLIPPTRLAEEAEIRSKIRRGTLIDHFDTVRQRKDGTRVHVSVTISPIYDRNGRIVGASKIARDIADRRRVQDKLTASEAHWRHLAEAMPHLVWTMRDDGHCDFVSAQWCAYTGQPERDQLGFGWVEAIHPEDRAGLENAWNKAAHARGILDAEVRIRRSDGVYRWFKTRAVPVMDKAGNIAKWYGSNTDIEDIRRTDADLRDREARLSAIFEQAGSGIIQTDLDGRIVMVNDAYCDIVQRTRRDLIGALIHEITHPEDRVLHQRPFEEMLRGGSAFIVEKRDLRPDGSAVWVRDSVVGIRDADGRVLAGLIIAHDITESREAEDAMRASEEQLRLVTDHAPVLLAQFDRQHRYKFVNAPYARRYGAEPREVIGKHVSAVVGQRAYQSALHYLDLAFTGRRVEFEMEIPYEGLGPRWGHVIFVPERGPAGEVVGVVAVLTDITLRKEAERELEAARDEALAAVRAKDDFLARLSHELRTPLSPVLLLASEATNNPDLPEAARADFEMIRKNVDLEARLIDDLLDLTRITRGKLALDLRNVHLHAVMRDAVATMRTEAERKGLEIELLLEAPEPHVNGDPVRLQQVFWNLLNNSVKFTSRGGKITLHTELTPTGDAVIIEVRDTGIGMTWEELERIFDAFSQGDHAGAPGPIRFGGLGLGLAISRMLIDLHRGQIRADSQGRGKGAVFTIELPLIRPSQAPALLLPADAQATTLLSRGPTSPAPAPASVRPLRILLVEDHEPTRVALSSLLGRRGHQVCSAESLAHARELAAADHFEILVSDIGLPDGTGYELMAELRQKSGLTGVALSGYGMEQDVARSHAAGFTAHLTKPVRMEALMAAIAEAAQTTAGNAANRVESGTATN